jgi:hypothetical protein
MGEITLTVPSSTPTFDARAAELALGRDLQVLEALRIEKVGMRVEPVDHSVDRFLDELLVGNRLDVVALDPAEHGGQELQVFVRDRQLRLALGDHREIERQEHTEERRPSRSDLPSSNCSSRISFYETVSSIRRARNGDPH